MLVIDNSHEPLELLHNVDFPFITGDATSEDILIEAGIERARGLVALVSSDADNLFITMTAKGLNPSLYILARADEESTEKKLLRAGANRVVLPYLIGGRKVAETIIKPNVTDFLELTVHNKDIGLQMEELIVNEKSRLIGLPLIDSGIRKDMNIIIVAIRESNGRMKFNPSSHTIIGSGDTLIALGSTADLEKLEHILAGN